MFVAAATIYVLGAVCVTSCNPPSAYATIVAATPPEFATEGECRAAAQRHTRAEPNYNWTCTTR